MRHRIKAADPTTTVVFCGGTGTRYFASTLANTCPNVSFIINAYDDGLSTGRIRRHLGVVGPSDLAKMLSNLCGNDHPAKAILDARLSSTSAAQCAADALAILRDASLDSSLFAYFWGTIAAFTEVVIDGDRRSRAPFDWADTAVRNMILIGASVLEGSVQAGVDELAGRLCLPSRVVLANERPDVLVGIDADGRLIPTEFDVSFGADRAPLVEVQIVRDWPDARTIAAVEVLGDPARTSANVRAHLGVLPALASPVANALVREADNIVYAPGTLLSSIVPSVMLLQDAIRTSSARKLLVANLVQEMDRTTAAHSIETAWRCAVGQAIGRVPERSDIRSFVSDVLVDYRRIGEVGRLERGEYIPIDIDRLQQLVTVHLADIENQDRVGTHDPLHLVSWLIDFFGNGSAPAGVRAETAMVLSA